jgi:hypothetical protein
VFLAMTDSMSEGGSEMSEKLSGDRSVRELVALVAGPRDWHDNRKSWLGRAAQRAGITYRQAKALFYGEITDNKHKSARLMRDAAADHYDSLAHLLAARDPDFYRQEIAAYVDLARALRRLDQSRECED